METYHLKRKRFFPFLQDPKNKMIFTLINIYLVIGVSGLLITIGYLLIHLNISDNIIYRCIPGFALGVSSGIVYLIGYHSISSGKSKQTSHHKVGQSPYSYSGHAMCEYFLKLQFLNIRYAFRIRYTAEIQSTSS